MGRIRLLDTACDLDRYESDEDKCIAVFTSMQLQLFRVLLTCEQIAKVMKDGGAEGKYNGRDVYEMLDDLRAKTEAALRVLADDGELEDMRRTSGWEDEHA
jgi:hypothetical protein